MPAFSSRFRMAYEVLNNSTIAITHGQMQDALDEIGPERIAQYSFRSSPGPVPGNTPGIKLEYWINNHLAAGHGRLIAWIGAVTLHPDGTKVWIITLDSPGSTQAKTLDPCWRHRAPYTLTGRPRTPRTGTRGLNAPQVSELRESEW